MAKDNLDDAVETKEQQFQAKLQEATHKADMQLRAKDGPRGSEDERCFAEDSGGIVFGGGPADEAAAAQQTISDNHLELSHHRSEHHTHKKSAQDILQSHQQFVRRPGVPMRKFRRARSDQKGPR